MPMMTRTALDLEEVLAYADAAEKFGGTSQVTVCTRQHKYHDAIEPHDTYRVWITLPEEKDFDAVDTYYAKHRPRFKE